MASVNQPSALLQKIFLPGPLNTGSLNLDGRTIKILSESNPTLLIGVGRQSSWIRFGRPQKDMDMDILAVFWDPRFPRVARASACINLTYDCRLINAVMIMTSAIPHQWTWDQDRQARFAVQPQAAGDVRGRWKHEERKQSQRRRASSWSSVKRDTSNFAMGCWGHWDPWLAPEKVELRWGKVSSNFGVLIFRRPSDLASFLWS
ncbi:hypothetical protein DFH07DRAFT_770857 [Mycena maculata]|uniref:Uncharacterized protein n=1 Tax=Mycena maculata TaxID=230809 RepID=A0AAD7JER9_9AGAR|nr:hypothetical protein DFH07DRAFT_770857 [Mycena maculata]